MDGEDLLETWMNKGESGKLGSRRLFGYFLAAQKVTRRRNPWAIKTAIHLFFCPKIFYYPT
jgi:hypothetical protein